MSEPSKTVKANVDLVYHRSSEMSEGRLSFVCGVCGREEFNLGMLWLVFTDDGRGLIACKTNDCAGRMFDGEYPLSIELTWVLGGPDPEPWKKNHTWVCKKGCGEVHQGTDEQWRMQICPVVAS